MTIKVLSFDIDGTIVDFSYNKAFWDEAIPRLYSKRQDISLEEAKKIVFAEFKKVSQKDVRWYRPSFWFKKFGIGDHNKVLRDLRHHINLYPDVLPSLRLLSKNYKLVVITGNTEEFLDMKLEAEGLGKFFSRRYSVTDMFKGAKSPEVFRVVAGELGIFPGNLLHVGDDAQFDYFEPRNLGAHAVLLDRGDSPEIFRKPSHRKKVLPNHVIGNLRDLQKKIDEINHTFLNTRT